MDRAESFYLSGPGSIPGGDTILIINPSINFDGFFVMAYD
jgi:hypothetical protein